ncbi:hypothetical protein L1049_004068 [Liquidambar formosana]|uniref:Uncharacterized protein n=1 Tax=Liquidambar formosana TaxID=63359 RepID=A0AAP0RNW6_LIQFO
MGGDRASSQGEESSLEQDFSELSSQTATTLGDGLSMKVEDGTVNEEYGLVFGEFGAVGRRSSSTSLEFDAHERMTKRVYREIFQSYDNCGFVVGVWKRQNVKS